MVLDNPSSIKKLHSTLRLTLFAKAKVRGKSKGDEQNPEMKWKGFVVLNWTRNQNSETGVSDERTISPF